MIRLSHGVGTTGGRGRRVKEGSYLVVPPVYQAADGTRMDGRRGDGDA
jgi:hypothetical protein